MEELEKLSKPLIDYLKNNYHPHTAIVITEERVAVIETVLSIPKKCMDFADATEEVMRGEYDVLDEHA